MGGDFGASVTVPAALGFANRYPDCELLLVGQQETVESALSQCKADPSLLERVEVVHASEVVLMDDPVEVALRRKKDSSMRVAAELVKAGRAQACVSAGNTGAWMAITRYVLKTLEGIDRPAIATAMPNQKGGTTTVLDLGANVDCTAEHLLQFAIMGTALAQVNKPDSQPSVGLLNIGEEVIKGNDTVKLAAEYLRASHLNFYGNVEGNDIFRGTVDVVVCDGFVGNVVLKAVEGLARMLGSMIHEEFHRSPLTKLAGLFARPVLNRFKKRVDNRQYNGAALLGLRGVVFKSHGSADVYAFGCALDRAYDAVSTGLLDRIASTISELTRLPAGSGADSLDPQK
ncbi:phosphate acyltransferase PlsX [Orrella marina]|uniref:Phosphate acyltransferase n=1 Tax=Orrella marina TaxID=2163011 RepID=A0A2R4XPJ2_9BURK|nr:phosphate acyltransferase PlsX [Orrella marina]AWB35732.1 phosphate acyltransferase PlsX [Orrella marina]